MKEQNLVELEPLQARRRRRVEKPRKADLREVAGRDMLILASCVGNSIVRGLELRERNRLVRTALIVISAGVTLLGVAMLIVRLLKG